MKIIRWGGVERVMYFFFLFAKAQVVWLFSGDDEGLLFINLKFSLYLKSISPYQLNVKRKRGSNTKIMLISIQ